jgi:predicted ATPase
MRQVREEFFGYEVVDLLVAANAYAAWNEWMGGHMRVALEYCEASLQVARGIGHAFSRALSLSFAAWFHQFRRDAVRTRACATEAIALSSELGLQMWIGWNHVLLGWAMLSEDRPGEARALIRQGLREWRATGSELGVSYFLTILAEAEARAGQVEAGLEALIEAQQFVYSSGERFWLPELLRQRALLLEQTGAPAAQVVQTLLEACDEAARSGSRMLELRVLLGLYQRQQGAERESARRAALTLLGQLGEAAEGREVTEARELFSTAA